MYKFNLVAFTHVDERSAELLYIINEPMVSDFNGFSVSFDRSNCSNLVPVKSTHGTRQPTEYELGLVPLPFVKRGFDTRQQTIIAMFLLAFGTND